MDAKKALLGTLLFLLCSSGRSTRECRELLRRELNLDQKFQAYFSELLSERVLDREQLQEYVKALEEGRIENPVTDRVALVNWKAQIHRDSLQGYIDGGQLTLEGQLAWAGEKLQYKEYSRERREITEEDTRKLPLEVIFPTAKMVSIKGGKFTMGSRGGERGRFVNEKQVAVELSPFEMMDTPVTQGMWYEVMGENPSFFQDCKKFKVVKAGVSLCPDHPVERVGWDDVQRFLKKLNHRLGLSERESYRLPTEAQWEYAARGGTVTAYSFGEDPTDLDQYAWYKDNAGYQTHPVRSKQPNPWGLYDMHGNVWEWVQDYYSKQLPGGRDPLQRGHMERRIVRGGSWLNHPPSLRSASRSNDLFKSRYSGVGFRLSRIASY